MFSYNLTPSSVCSTVQNMSAAYQTPMTSTQQIICVFVIHILLTLSFKTNVKWYQNFGIKNVKIIRILEWKNK